MDAPRSATASRLAATVQWLIPFALVAYLGVRGGGYDTIVRGEVGLIAWGVLLVGGLGSRYRFREFRGPTLWLAVILLGLLAWSGLALAWTESTEKTFEELSRIVTYTGVFLLVAALVRRGSTENVVRGLAAAIVLIGTLALFSQLHPAWFPVDELAENQLGGQARLNYPLNYWNGLATLLAMAMPLLAWFAARRADAVISALASAAIPILALGIYFTFSRTGLIAGLVGLAAFVALRRRRITTLARIAPAGVASGILTVIASTMDALVAGAPSETASDQGNLMIPFVFASCIGAAGARFALHRAESRGLELTIAIPKRAALYACAGAAVAVVIAGVAANAPGRIADQWEEFKQPASPAATGGTSRFASTSGSGRYQYWGSSLDAFAVAPVTGIGPGTFELWWSREGTITAGFVKQAHSLYLETLAELGLVGLLLVLALVVLTIFFGVRARLRIPSPNGTTAAAATGAAAVFAVAAISDWIWEFPVITIAFLITAAVIARLATPGDSHVAVMPSSGHALAKRVAAVVVAFVAIVVVAISVAGAELMRQSRSAGDRGEYGLAAERARDAAELQPFAASPKLQEALALEAMSNLDGAAVAAQEATEREPTNWRTWYALSTIDATRGATEASERAFEQARALNPRSSLFPQEAPPSE